MTLQSKLTDHEVKLIAEVKHDTELDAQSFLRKQEWRIYSNISFSDKDKDDVGGGVTNHVKHPVLLATCTASRCSGFYIWNYMLVMVGLVQSLFSSLFLMRTQHVSHLLAHRVIG